MGSAIVDGKLLVYGGNDAVTAYTDIYEYDPVGETWTTRSEKLNQQRTYFATTLAGDASGVTCS